MPLVFSPFSTTWRQDVVDTIGNGQIAFPATQNPSSSANVLDDYEEGVWTPTISAGTGTFTSVSASGIYTKIGRFVAYSLTITITTNGTAGSYIVFTLPFTASTTAGMTCYGRENSLTGSSISSGPVSSSALFVVFYNNTYPGASGAGFHISGHFMT